MSRGALISTTLFILGALAVLVQLWFAPWSQELFNKIIITLSVLFVVAVVLSFVLREAAATRKLKSGKDL